VKALVEDCVYHVHFRVVLKFHGQVEFGPVVPLADKFEASSNHAPEQLSEHVYVEVATYFFQALFGFCPRRHVIARADTLIQERDALGQVWQKGDSKITENQTSAIPHENIRRLYVAVKDVVFVECRHSFNQWTESS